MASVTTSNQTVTARIDTRRTGESQADLTPALVNGLVRHERPATDVEAKPSTTRGLGRQPRVAVIGLGYWGPNLVRNFQAVLGDNLHAICDRDPARAKNLTRTYPDVRLLTEAQAVFQDDDVDAVVIATPVHTHYPLARAALEAGKSVLVEKPMCDGSVQAQELVDLARANNLTLMTDHTFVFHPAVRKMKEILDSGQLGEILFIDSIRINLGLFQRDINVVWDLAPHDLSIVDYLIGREAKSLSAFGAAHAGNGIESIAYLNLDFGDGLIANFHVNWLSPVKVRHTMVGGSKQSLIYNDLDQVQKIKVYDSGITVRDDDLEGRRQQLIDYRTGDVWSPRVVGPEALRSVAEHFIHCVQTGETPITDGEAGLRIVRILEAAQHSIKAQGGRITL